MAHSADDFVSIDNLHLDENGLIMGYSKEPFWIRGEIMHSRMHIVTEKTKEGEVMQGRFWKEYVITIVDTSRLPIHISIEYSDLSPGSAECTSSILERRYPLGSSLTFRVDNPDSPYHFSWKPILKVEDDNKAFRFHYGTNANLRLHFGRLSLFERIVSSCTPEGSYNGTNSPGAQVRPTYCNIVQTPGDIEVGTPSEMVGIVNSFNWIGTPRNPKKDPCALLNFTSQDGIDYDLKIYKSSYAKRALLPQFYIEEHQDKPVPGQAFVLTNLTCGYSGSPYLTPTSTFHTYTPTTSLPTNHSSIYIRSMDKSTNDRLYRQYLLKGGKKEVKTGRLAKRMRERRETEIKIKREPLPNPPPKPARTIAIKAEKKLTTPQRPMRKSTPQMMSPKRKKKQRLGPDGITAKSREPQ